MMTPTKRIDLARKLWGWRPHPSQREWLLDDHPVKVAACGRRWGKTEAAAVDVATYAIANNGSVQMIVAPTYDQSKLISRTVERLLLGHPELRRYTDLVRTPYTEIRFRKSRIMARTADDDGRNLRGHSADRVVVDEAAFVRDEVIEEVIGPMLADRNGRLVLISTPFGKNHFYRAFLKGMANGQWLMANGESGSSAMSHEPSAISRFSSFRFPSWANPHISREYIEAQREIVTERQFKVEYEAEFIDDQSAVFAWEDIQEATANGKWLMANGESGSSAISHPPSAIRVAGIDWARYSDYTAVAVVEMANGSWSMANEGPDSGPSTINHGPSAILPVSHQPSAIPHFRVLCVDRFNRMEWRAQVERVADLLAKYRVRAVAADQTSVGDPVIENLRHVLWAERMLDVDVEGVVFTNQTKREMIDNLALRLAHREIAIPIGGTGEWGNGGVGEDGSRSGETLPHHLELVRELQYYEYELTESGNVRTGARRGYHDDCVCALALALRIAPRFAWIGGFHTSGRIRESVTGW